MIDLIILVFKGIRKADENQTSKDSLHDMEKIRYYTIPQGVAESWKYSEVHQTRGKHQAVKIEHYGGFRSVHYAFEK